MPLELAQSTALAPRERSLSPSTNGQTGIVRRHVVRSAAGEEANTVHVGNPGSKDSELWIVRRNTSGSSRGIRRSNESWSRRPSSPSRAARDNNQGGCAATVVESGVLGPAHVSTSGMESFVEGKGGVAMMHRALYIGTGSVAAPSIG